MHTMRMIVAGTGLILFLAGCAAPNRTGDPVAYTWTASDDAERERLWEASATVLREHLFDLRVVDPRAGTIVTAPSTSEHFFEFWRHDVDTPYDFAEATLRTVRRTVAVQLSPVDTSDEPAAENADEEWRLVVTVGREYLSTPERQFNSSIAAFQMFATELPRADTGRRVRPEDTRWIDAGRDLAMERYLRDRILNRAGLLPANRAPSA